jgi:hypothetical protein
MWWRWAQLGTIKNVATLALSLVTQSSATGDPPPGGGRLVALVAVVASRPLAMSVT